MFWKNKGINCIVNSRITEFDIKSGNTSIMKEFHLAEEDRINEIENMEKKDRVITVGYMMREKEFSKALEQGFDEIVKRFIDENNLDIDFDIIDIMRDAVFVISKPIINTIFGHCNFVEKNVYDGYLRCNQYEFFINSNSDTIDVKGISDTDIQKFESGPIQMIKYIYAACSEFHLNKEQMSRYMKDLVIAYKNKELPLEYYREFNGTGMFKLKYGDHVVVMDSISENDLDNLDISYNYINLIIPIIMAVC